ncbi:MAG TPA: hypothetical protein ENL04_01870, partial [Sulfuricurvum sp.]|nr:hypothetical protein [Sulfuricurvum sp.]
AALPLHEKVLLLAAEFRTRLASLVAEWIRVGYCQGNFNSDNCAAGGFTLDYGPFGFIDLFDPRYQPWTGGGVHFSFLNQPKAAERNFKMFCAALKPLLTSNPEALQRLEQIENSFPAHMQWELQKMWAAKLGLSQFDPALFKTLVTLMVETSVDYTIFFRELSSLPDDIGPLANSFYGDAILDKALAERWSQWLEEWKMHLHASITETPDARKQLSQKMKAVNPKYTLREWFLVPAYRQAEQGDYTLLRELQEVMTDPYAEQSVEIEKKYYRQKPQELFDIAGISHVSCSS